MGRHSRTVRCSHESHEPKGRSLATHREASQARQQQGARRESQRRRLLRELRSATRRGDWPRIHALRAVLDEVSLVDELAIAIAAHDHPGDHYSLRASAWIVRLLVERPIGGLWAIARLVTLMQHLERPAARMQLAGLLGALANIDARAVLGVPIPPAPTPHEHLPDYLERLRRIGMLDAFSAYERAQQAALHH